MAGASKATLNWNEIDQSILTAINAMQAARARLKNDSAPLAIPMVDPEALNGQPPLRGCLISSYFVDAEQLLQISRVQLMIARSISAGATFLPAGNAAMRERASGHHFLDIDVLRLIGAYPARSENAGLKVVRHALKGIKSLLQGVQEAFRGSALRMKVAKRRLQRFIRSAIGARRPISNAQRMREPQKSLEAAFEADRPSTTVAVRRLVAS